MDPSLNAPGERSSASATPADAGTAPSFRDADAALLCRLEDERAASVLFGAEAPRGSEPLPARARVLVRELRAIEGGARAAALAVGGDPTELGRLLRSPSPRWSMLLHHAAASYFARLAASIARARFARRDAEAEGETRAFMELDARVRCVASWLALSTESTFLTEMILTMAGGALSRDDAAAMAGRMAAQVIAALGREAEAGAGTLEAGAAVALRALGRASEACRMGMLPAAETKRFLSLADRTRAKAVDAALAPIEDELAEASARAAPTPELATIFGRVRDVWLFTDRDEAVERFAVDNVSTPAWEIYRRAGWTELRALLTPCIPLYESLEARIRGSVGDFAYSAKCAQVILFLSETESDRAREWALAERALALCPTHRNTRLNIAHLSSDLAIKTLARSSVFTARSDIAQATALVERAEALFPQSSRTEEARAKLDAARARWGVR